MLTTGTVSSLVPPPQPSPARGGGSSADRATSMLLAVHPRARGRENGQTLNTITLISPPPRAGEGVFRSNFPHIRDNR